jgi:hypothetical protein
MSSSSRRSIKLPVFEQTVEGRGNCFYNALYAALKERDLLKQIVQVYPVTARMTFNKYFRSLIAAEISKKPPKRIIDDYTKIENAYSIARTTCGKSRDEFGDYQPLNECIAASISSSKNVPIWLVNNYIKARAEPRSNKQTYFIEHYISSIRTEGNEVQEMETEVAQRLLKAAGILLKIVDKGYEANNTDYFYLLSSDSDSSSDGNGILDIPYELPYETSEGEPIIYLLNVQSEKHFNYFSFNEHVPNGGKKYRTRRKKLRTTKSGKRNNKKSKRHSNKKK